VSDDAPGRLWFDRFYQAFLAADLDAIWTLQTAASRALVLERMAEAVARAGSDAEYRRHLRERMGTDIAGMEPKAAWEAFTGASCRHMASGDIRWTYAGEESDGDRRVVRIAAGGRALPAGFDGEMEQVLVLEEGQWRLDKHATEQRPRTP